MSADIVHGLYEARVIDQKPVYYTRRQIEGLIKDNLTDIKDFKAPSEKAYDILLEHHIIGVNKDGNYRHLKVPNIKIQTYRSLYNKFGENYDEYFGTLKMKKVDAVKKSARIISTYLKDKATKIIKKNEENEMSMKKVKKLPKTTKSVKKNEKNEKDRKEQIEKGKKKANQAIKTTKIVKKNEKNVKHKNGQIEKGQKKVKQTSMKTAKIVKNKVKKIPKNASKIIKK